MSLLNKFSFIVKKDFLLNYHSPSQYLLIKIKSKSFSNFNQKLNHNKIRNKEIDDEYSENFRKEEIINQISEKNDFNNYIHYIKKKGYKQNENESLKKRFIHKFNFEFVR